MLKILLKSSVIIFILLGTITTVTPSHGMEQEPEPKKILVPFKGKPILFDQPFEENGSVSIFPKDMLLFSFTFLDYNGALNAERGCKRWREIIRRDGKSFEHFIPHPANIFWMHEQMVPLCPLQHISDLFGNDILGAPMELNPQISNMINYIADSISKDSGFLHFLGRKYINLNPIVDCQEVCFASQVAKKSLSFRDYLEIIEIRHPQIINQFPELLKSSKNYQLIQQFLMMVKILTLSDNKNARGEMEQYANLFICKIADDSSEEQDFEGPISINPLTKEELLERKAYLKHYLNWAAYTDDTDILELQFERLSNLLLENDGIEIDVQDIKIVGNYYFSLLKTDNYSCKEYFALLATIYKQKNDQPNLLETLDHYYAAIKKSYADVKLSDIIDLASNYCNVNYYERAKLIFEEAFLFYQGSPVDVLLAGNAVQCILASQDKANFPQAKRYIQYILEKDLEKNNIIESPMRGNKSQTYRFGKYEALSLKAVLDIYEGNFENAYQTLKGLIALDNEVEESDSFDAVAEDMLWELNIGMMSAVYDQCHNPSLPKELVALMSQKVRDILSLHETLDKKGQQAFRKIISKYSEALSFILQGYPEDFEKLQSLLDLDNVKQAELSEEAPSSSEPFPFNMEIEENK